MSILKLDLDAAPAEGFTSLEDAYINLVDSDWAALNSLIDYQVQQAFAQVMGKFFDRNGYQNNFCESCIRPIARAIVMLQRIVASDEIEEVWIRQPLGVVKGEPMYFAADGESFGNNIYDRNQVIGAILIRFLTTLVHVRVRPIYYLPKLTSHRLILGLKPYVLLLMTTIFAERYQVKDPVDPPQYLALVRNESQKRHLALLLGELIDRTTVVEGETFFSSFRKKRGCIEVSKLVSFFKKVVEYRSAVAGQKKDVFIEVCGVVIYLNRALRELDALRISNEKKYKILRCIIEKRSVGRQQALPVITFEVKSPEATRLSLTQNTECLQFQNMGLTAHYLPFPVQGSRFFARTPHEKRIFQQAWGPNYHSKVEYEGTLGYREALLDSFTIRSKICIFSSVRPFNFLSKVIGNQHFKNFYYRPHPRDFSREAGIIRGSKRFFDDQYYHLRGAVSFCSAVVPDILLSGVGVVLVVGSRPEFERNEWYYQLSSIPKIDVAEFVDNGLPDYDWDELVSEQSNELRSLGMRSFGGLSRLIN